MGWNFYNASGELQINDGGVQASAAVFTGKVDLGSNLLVGNAGSTGIAISANGEVTMAAQPAVLANNSAADNSATGNNTTATVEYDTEIFDQNADFASNTFTAPITGRYFINAGIGMGDQSADATTRHAIFVASNRSLPFIYDVTKVAGTPFAHSIWRGATIMDMDAADTLTITVRVNGQGSDAVDVTDTGTYISICLLA